AMRRIMLFNPSHLQTLGGAGDRLPEDAEKREQRLRLRAKTEQGYEDSISTSPLASAVLPSTSLCLASCAGTWGVQLLVTRMRGEGRWRLTMDSCWLNAGWIVCPIVDAPDGSEHR